MTDASHPRRGDRPPLKRRLIYSGLCFAISAALIGVAQYLIRTSEPPNLNEPPRPEFTIPLSSLASAGVSPYCDRMSTCIVEESPGQFIALFMRDTTEYFGARGCFARWEPDFDLSTVNCGTGRGAFRSNCSGATFDITGKLLFGPAPRGLDRYRTKVVNERLVVNFGIIMRSP